MVRQAHHERFFCLEPFAFGLYLVPGQTAFTTQGMGPASLSGCLTWA